MSKNGEMNHVINDKGEKEVKISDLNLYENNPTMTNQSQQEVIQNSLNLYGWQRGVLVWKDGIVVDGHQRVLAAKEMGWETAEIVYAKKSNGEWLSDMEVKALRIMLNQSAKMHSWDETKLRIELQEISVNISKTKVELSEVSIGKLTGLSEKFLNSNYLGETPDFRPGTEEEQGQLDKLKPIIVKCPECGCEHNARETKVSS